MATSDNRHRWILTICIGVVAMGVDGVAAIFHLGLPAALVSVIVPAAMVLAYVAKTRDGLFARLLVFGIVVGFGELPADALDVLVSKTLVYPQDQPMIWTSPAYMPFAWMMVMVQMGFIAWWLRGRFGVVKAMIIMAVLGSTYVPAYEVIAKYAEYWYYRDCPMAFHAAPYYVILTEAAICLAMPVMIGTLEKQSWPRVLGLGVAMSVWILGTEWIFTALTV